METIGIMAVFSRPKPQTWDPHPCLSTPVVVLNSERMPSTVNPIKLETGLRPNSAGIPYTLLLLRIEATGFPTFWLLL